jgi:hypothetical protein
MLAVLCDLSMSECFVRPWRSRRLFYTARVRLYSLLSTDPAQTMLCFSRLDELNLVRTCQIASVGTNFLFQLFSNRSEQLWSTPITGWPRQGGRKSRAAVQCRRCAASQFSPSPIGAAGSEKRKAAARRRVRAAFRAPNDRPVGFARGRTNGAAWSRMDHQLATRAASCKVK